MHPPQLKRKQMSSCGAYMGVKSARSFPRADKNDGLAEFLNRWENHVSQHLQLVLDCRAHLQLQQSVSVFHVLPRAPSTP